MQFNRQEAIQRMNEMGKKREPFLFIIDFEAKHTLLIPQPFLNETPYLFKINELRNYNIINTPLEKEVILEKKPIPFSQYQRAFDYCVKEMNYGNSYLLNLTFPTPIELNLTLEEVFYHSRAKYKLFVPGHFVCFSPETFVQINDGIISSNPMKGTISAEIPNAAQRILEDKKEMGEHNTIVDFIRNDLNLVAKKIHVKDFRYIDRIITNKGDLLQVSSQIEGILPNNYQNQIGHIIFKLLPAGSITGAPKRKTLEIIKTAEGYDRGFYTGVFGYFDGKNLDSAVSIRFIEQQGQLIFKSGGGITAQSNAKAEYQEMIDKVYVPIRNIPMKENSTIGSISNDVLKKNIH
jgi:para-aminobenzoate synthetase component 1